MYSSPINKRGFVYLNRNCGYVVVVLLSKYTVLHVIPVPNKH